MTLGEKIAQLRNDRRMSQGDLAERLNVSRQSVSKWETGASIPDLDKLLLLSDLFEVSLDDLARGDAPPAAPVAEPAPTPRTALNTQQMVGFLLLGVGLLGMLLGFLLSGALLALSGYLSLCGVLCVAVRRPVGVFIGWLTLLPILMALPRFTGTRLSAVFEPGYYRQGLVMNLVIAFALWAALLALVRVTVRQTPLRAHLPLVIGWVVFSQMWRSIPVALGMSGYREATDAIPAAGALILLAVLLFFTGKALVRHQKFGRDVDREQ